MPIDQINNAQLCLATVTTNSFVPGTLTMIYSFLKNNPWFSGDLLIIQDCLSGENQGHLSALYENTRFVEIGAELVTRVDKLVDEFPDFEKKRSRFSSLQAFRTEGYDRILFCDSDLLFRGSIQPLFDLSEPLIVCGDRFYYEGNPREWGLNENLDGSEEKKTALYYNTFNAGLMLFDKSVVNKDTYARLLELVDPKIYRNYQTELTDQMILNIFFSGKPHLVDAKYNYLMLHREIISKHLGVHLSDAIVLHFNGRAKPWNADQLISAASRYPAYLEAFRFWFDAFIECLQELSIRTRFKDGGGG